MRWRQILALAAVLGPALSGEAACEYEVTIIEGPSCGIFGPATVSPWAMNDLGHFAGSYTCVGDEHAFVWTPEEGIVPLPMPSGFAFSIVFGMNNAGDLVGELREPGPGHPDAVLWRDGEAILLGIPPGGTYSVAHAINDEGMIVGDWGNHITGGPARAAFVWQDGEMLDLGPIIGTEGSSADGIGESGEIVGWMGTALSDARAFQLSEGIITDLGVVSGGYSGHGVDVNRHGQIVGWGHVIDPESGDQIGRSFIWSEGHIEALGVLRGYRQLEVRSLNDAGQAVGYASPESGAWRAFLWQNGVLLDVNDLVPPLKDPVHIATGVNASGQIAGTAGRPAVLLTPIGQPTTDLNIDCTTDSYDLIILLEDWQETDSPADFDGDGVVGLGDLLLLLAHWG